MSVQDISTGLSILPGTLIDPTYPLNWAHPLNQSRVAWWKVVANSGWRGSNVWHDLVRGQHKARDYTQSGSPVWGSARGLAGSNGALNFTGSTTYFSGSDVGFPTGLSAWSIMCWLYTNVTSESSSIERFIFAWGTAASWERADLQIFTGLLTYDPFGTKISGATTIATGKWYHGAITFDGTNIRIYLNGRLDGGPTAPGSSLNLTLNGTASIGTPFDNLGNANFTWNGALDNIQVFNRVLSPQDVYQDYVLSRQGYPGVLNYVTPVEYSLSTPGAWDASKFPFTSPYYPEQRLSHVVAY